MTTALEHLQAANRLLELRLREAAARQLNSDEKWQSLSAAGSVVSELASLVSRLPQHDRPAALASELDRYAANLTHLQRECEQIVSHLSARRTKLWHEEQALRARAAWRQRGA